MKIPYFKSPEKIEGYSNLPAVATVVAGGFCSECAAVARFGDTTKTAHVYILLRYDARRRIAECVKIDAIHERIPSDLDRRAFLRGNNDAGFWYNGESLWVSVEWLRMVRAMAGDLNVGSRLAFGLLDALD